MKDENTFTAQNIWVSYFDTVKFYNGYSWPVIKVPGPCKKDKEVKECNESDCQVNKLGGFLTELTFKIFDDAWRINGGMGGKIEDMFFKL